MSSSSPLIRNELNVFNVLFVSFFFTVYNVMFNSYYYDSVIFVIFCLVPLVA